MIRALSVYDTISNVTEWAKKKYCWDTLVEKLDSGELKLSEKISEILLNREDEKSEEKEARKEQKVDNELDMMKKVVTLGSSRWQEILDKGIKENMFSEAEIALIRKASSVEKTGKLPTKKQIKRLCEILARFSY